MTSNEVQITDQDIRDARDPPVNTARSPCSALAEHTRAGSTKTALAERIRTDCSPIRRSLGW
ncbi:hypothetical protein IFM12275_21830 [Nocardia sputorum]|uniref:Uncharacterized protein n=1 Tax=Nocardia sputorum TaxID=2984338 RepID=A0ABN6U6L0_9NOCA|nr:hypothetical protein IFM12275_21830 [Nocardia sputorum]BDU00810.1 hypothetical protein IFM12276_38380 [Nocardia sputorum]